MSYVGIPKKDWPMFKELDKLKEEGKLSEAAERCLEESKRLARAGHKRIRWE